MSRSRHYDKHRPRWLRQVEVLGGERAQVARARGRDHRSEIWDGVLEHEDHAGDYSSDFARITMLHDVRYRGQTRRHLTRGRRRRWLAAWVREYLECLRASGHPMQPSGLTGLHEAVSWWLLKNKKPIGPVVEAVARYIAHRIKVQASENQVLRSGLFRAVLSAKRAGS